MARDLASGIYETASSLGMDPIDLATIISYETGGTFDPQKAGPTTQWGQHRGLIQFGEPQAREYGVDWQDPVGSQLGANGAVARYFRGNGWQEGMGMLDAYSIVNAGGPGRYNASDANNGGAPGSVADKVREQMGGHRRNAERILGEMGNGATPQGAQPSIQPGLSATAQPDAFSPQYVPMPPPYQTAQGAPMRRIGQREQQPQGNALAQVRPPEYRNALNVADFIQPIPRNALTRT